MGCSYCEHIDGQAKLPIDLGTFDVGVFGEVDMILEIEQKGVFSIFTLGEHALQEKVRINYCPKCGRKLYE